MSNFDASSTVPRGSTGADAPKTASEIVTRETYHARGGAMPHYSSSNGPWRRHVLTRVDFALAGAILLAAVLARWPFVEAGRTLLNPDEAIVGLMAQDIAAGERFPIYFYGQRYMGSLEAFLIAAASPLFDDHVRALRFAPSCVFAAFAALQFLMLTRWFGRRAALIGATALLAASPMFVHWSVSARGGYIEILLFGTALLWAYSEWFMGGLSGGRSTALGEHVFCKGGMAAAQGGHAPSTTSGASLRNRRFLFGLIFGSGFWINPTIALFAIPAMLHALLNRPLAAIESSPRAGNFLSTARRLLGHTTLLVFAMAAVLAMNSLFTSWVDQGNVRYLAMLGLVSKPVAGIIIAALAGVAAFLLWKKTTLLHLARAAVMANAAMIVGAAVGATPAIVYLAQTTLKLRAMDPSLPMGIRPLWLTGETIVYFLHGLPMLFGADPRPFVQLMGVGYADVSNPLSIEMSAFVSAGSWLVLGGLVTLALLLIRSQAPALSRLLTLRAANHPPAVLLILALLVIVGLYVLGACTMNFTTIRYIVPLWAIIPGLIAAAVSGAGVPAYVGHRFATGEARVPAHLWHRFATGGPDVPSHVWHRFATGGPDIPSHVSGAGVPPASGGRGSRRADDSGSANVPFAQRKAGVPARQSESRFHRRLATIAALFCIAGWTTGQIAFRSQLGADHPMSAVAQALVANKVDHAVAEPLDAHLLSYLTNRQCKLEEFESFWTRLPHHQRPVRPGDPVTYLVQTGVMDCSQSWTDGGFPGWASPEAMRFLWPRMQWALARDPSICLSRRPVAAGYELITLRTPLPKPTAKLGEAPRVKAVASTTLD